MEGSIKDTIIIRGESYTKAFPIYYQAKTMLWYQVDSCLKKTHGLSESWAQ